MNRFLATCLLCLGTGLRAADEPPAPDTNAPGPANRYVLLLEASTNMKAQRDMALDTADKLILNSINGRLRPSDTLTVWAYSDRLETNLLNDLAWDPNARLDTANRIYRLLRNLSFSKRPNMEAAMEGLRRATNGPGILTAILVYSGSQPVSGTPFDNLVNEVTGRHREEMRKAGKPFVTVFLVRDGRYLNQAVTPGGRPVYLPPLPKPPPKPLVARPVPPPVSPPSTNKPKPLTIEEIQQAIQKNQKPTNPTAALTATAAAPLASPVPSSAPATPIDRAEPAPVPAPATAQAVSPASPPPPATPAPTPNLPKVAPPATASEAATNSVASPAGQGSPTLPGPPTAALAAPDAIAAGKPPPPARVAPPSAAALPPVPAPRSWTDLATGIALLLAAAGLAWVLIRNVRSGPRQSLISRSMDSGKD